MLRGAEQPLYTAGGNVIGAAITENSIGGSFNKNIFSLYDPDSSLWGMYPEKMKTNLKDTYTLIFIKVLSIISKT